MMAFKFPRVFLHFRLPRALVLPRGSRGTHSGAGSGVGSGGGGGGSIRDAGGAFGRRGVVKEEEYFRRKQREQLIKLRKKLESEREATTESQPKGEGPEGAGDSTQSANDADLQADALIKDQVFLLHKLEEYESLVKLHQQEIRRVFEMAEENLQVISHYQEEIGFLKSTMEIQKQFPELDLGREPRFEIIKPRTGSFES
ncbi:uncharacterized protein LOC125028319 isoform X2 [Penaeus chinensis]|uniref:uncharacterized protein LOC125028319 isoform X2 n=1 Tax=Penaeus chinensis TaxID=139456 RepID=UPI001FB5D276|nr:uncharacterized protein LOC125028319 isoform X2 [Penaeus chinensis]